MATRRSTRVTQVDPWIVGGEGQLRDLFPLPPWVFLIGRALSWLFRHFLITGVFLLALWLWIAGDWVWWLAFLVFPAVFLFLRTTLIVFYLWFKNPTIPLIARKN